MSSSTPTKIIRYSVLKEILCCSHFVYIDIHCTVKIGIVISKTLNRAPVQKECTHFKPGSLWWRFLTSRGSASRISTDCRAATSDSLRSSVSLRTRNEKKWLHQSVYDNKFLTVLIISAVSHWRLTPDMTAMFNEKCIDWFKLFESAQLAGKWWYRTLISLNLYEDQQLNTNMAVIWAELVNVTLFAHVIYISHSNKQIKWWNDDDVNRNIRT